MSAHGLLLSRELVGKAESLVLVVGFSFAVAMPLQPSTAILSGLQRFDIINMAMLVTLLLRTVLLIVLLLRGYGLITMGLIFGASEVLTRLYTLFLSGNS